MSDKPYSVEWWLKQHRQAVTKSVIAVYVGIPDTDMRDRYRSLASWIADRIAVKASRGQDKATTHIK